MVWETRFREKVKEKGQKQEGKKGILRMPF